MITFVVAKPHLLRPKKVVITGGPGTGKTSGIVLHGIPMKHPK